MSTKEHTIGTLVTVLVGLALAGATTFGLVSGQADSPAGSTVPPAAVTYDATP